MTHITNLSTISWDYTNQKHTSKEVRVTVTQYRSIFHQTLSCVHSFCFTQRRQNAGWSQLHSSVSMKIIGHFLPDWCSFVVKKKHNCFVFWKNLWGCWAQIIALTARQTWRKHNTEKKICRQVKKLWNVKVANGNGTASCTDKNYKYSAI